MTDKFTAYNLTLHHLGARRLKTLNDPIEARRTLDDFWDQTVQECLEEAQWNFMLREIQIDASTNVVPGFGWKYAFAKPNDWLRTTIVSTVDSFQPPLTDFTDQTGYWYANWTPLFIQYQSDDPQYGMNLGAWSAAFTAYETLLLAEYSCFKITGSTERPRRPQRHQRAAAQGAHQGQVQRRHERGPARDAGRHLDALAPRLPQQPAAARRRSLRRLNARAALPTLARSRALPRDRNPTAREQRS